MTTTKATQSIPFNTKLTPAMKRVLVGINEGTNWGTPAHETLDRIVRNGLATYDSNANWSLTDLGLAAITPFKPQEVAYQKLTMKGAGKWQRKIIKTQKAFDKFVEKMEDGDFNWEARDVDGF